MNARDLARSIAAVGLDCLEVDRLSAPLADAEWRELVLIVRQERLGGFLMAAIEQGALPVTHEQAFVARQLQFVGLGQVLAIEARGLAVIDRLVHGGVDVRVLKGSAVAHLDYPDPSVRHFIDLDLLVPSDHFDHAVDVFVTAGHIRRHRQPRPGFDRRFSKGTSFVIGGDLVVDLHRTFVMGPFGLRVDLADVWRSSSVFTMSGAHLQALDREVRFLHACFHAALGDVIPRLVPQRDVAQMLLDGRLDVTRVASLMRSWGACAVVAKAVAGSWRTLRLAADPDLVRWATEYRPTRRECRDLALYSDPDGSYARTSLGALRAVPGLRDKAAFAYALAFPEHSYVEGRYTSAGRRISQGLRAATGRRPRTGTE